MLRFPLKLIPSGVVVPVMQGVLKGKKWVVGSGDNHGYWLGSYEYRMQSFFAETIKPGSVVYDIGANVGFYTLLASKIVGVQGRVFAFEPLPENIFYVRKHVELNHCDNVVIIEAAVSEKNAIVFS
ncbi:MAG: FkbM family methyltransferase [Parcubacteria group bacterium]|nr:FkbM family methyltransferase [Parcubacteria group bacterium]